MINLILKNYHSTFYAVLNYFLQKNFMLEKRMEKKRMAIIH